MSTALADKVGVSNGTLLRWLREAPMNRMSEKSYSRRLFSERGKLIGLDHIVRSWIDEETVLNAQSRH